MRSFTYVGNEVRNQVAERVYRAESHVNDTATCNYNVATQELQRLGPLKDTAYTRNASREGGSSG